MNKDQTPESLAPENLSVESSMLTAYKYCHDVTCDLYDDPQRFTRVLCSECGGELFTTKA